MKLLLTVIIVFLVLMAVEVWWRHRSVHGEFSRKLIHILVGSYVAFWPLYLSWNDIKLLSLAFLLVVIVSKNQKIFKAIHSVQRPTWGEVYFALSVGIIAFMTHDKWIYLTALLLMSLADGLAAVVGVGLGKGRYRVLGHAKSISGTTTFFIVAIVILFCYAALEVSLPLHLQFYDVFGIAAAAALIENFGIAGLDNLLVPVVSAALLLLR